MQIREGYNRGLHFDNAVAYYLCWKLVTTRWSCSVVLAVISPRVQLTTLTTRKTLGMSKIGWLKKVPVMSCACIPFFSSSSGRADLPFSFSSVAADKMLLLHKLFSKTTRLVTLTFQHPVSCTYTWSLCSNTPIQAASFGIWFQK